MVGKLRQVVLPAFALLLASSGHAKSTVVNVLDKTGPTRAEAMGGATTAIGRDASLISVNPASSAQVARPSLTLSGQRGLFGEMLGQVVLAAPLTEGVMTFGAAYYDTGSADVITLDERTVNLQMQNDFMASLTYGKMLSPSWALAGTVKGLNSRMMDETTSAAFALDIGAQYRVNPTVKAGVSLQNLGTKLRYLDGAFSLPSAGRAGIALGLPSVGGRDLAVITGDAQFALTGEGITWGMGAEYQWSGMASLRAGIRLTPVKELATVAFGAGLVFQHYRLDYSVRMGKVFDSPQTLSLTIDFPRAITADPPKGETAPAPESFPPPATPEQATPVTGPATVKTPENLPLTAPVILPGAPAPLPMAPDPGTQKEDERRRELEELLRQTGEK